MLSRGRLTSSPPSSVLLFYLTIGGTKSNVVSFFFLIKGKKELVNNETMRRKVRVNVATFGRFADSVNHQQQHRRS